MVLTGQGIRKIPHQIENGTHINPEGVSLQATPSGGRGNPDTSTTSKYRGRYPKREEDRSGSTYDINVMVGRSTGYEGGKLEGLAKGGNMVKGSRHETLGKIDECEKVSVPRGKHPNGTDMDEYCANY